jgi:hypothetical protein
MVYILTREGQKPTAMPRPATRSAQSETHEALIAERAKAYRDAVTAAKRAQRQLGAAIYEAVSGGHLSEHAAARCARVSRAMSRRYTLGKGDFRKGRALEDAGVDSWWARQNR